MDAQFTPEVRDFLFCVEVDYHLRLSLFGQQSPARTVVHTTTLFLEYMRTAVLGASVTLGASDLLLLKYTGSSSVLPCVYAGWL